MRSRRVQGQIILFHRSVLLSRVAAPQLFARSSVVVGVWVVSMSVSAATPWLTSDRRCLWVFSHGKSQLPTVCPAVSLKSNLEGASHPTREGSFPTGYLHFRCQLGWSPELLTDPC